MMLLPGLQIHLWLRVTLISDLLNPKLIVSCPCPVDHCAKRRRNRFIHFHHIMFTSNTWTNGQHNGSVCQSGSCRGCEQTVKLSTNFQQGQSNPQS